MTEYAYVGRDPRCGCVVAATMDNPVHPKDAARDVAEWIRKGLIVERMDASEVGARFGGCAICRPGAAQKRML